MAGRIVPSILTDDRETLRLRVRQASAFADYVQFDVMDGQFVPTRSVSHDDLSGLSMPFKWEAHLMVMRPLEYIRGFAEAGASKVIVHVESEAPEKAFELARRLGIGVGVALNPDTTLAPVLPLAGVVDSVLFLTVHPGYYGGKFVPPVLKRVAEMRRAFPRLRIGVDGGVKDHNIQDIVRLGVDVIVIGSAIFLTPDPAASFERLDSLVRQVSHRRTSRH